jgi:hypothetical protein
MGVHWHVVTWHATCTPSTLFGAVVSSRSRRGGRFAACPDLCSQVHRRSQTQASHCRLFLPPSPVQRSALHPLIALPQSFSNDFTVLFARPNDRPFCPQRQYDGATCYLDRKRNKFLEFSVWVPALPGSRRVAIERDDPTFVVQRALSNAIIPCKPRASDTGYDLTLVKKVKDLGPLTALYDTGIKVRPPSDSASTSYRDRLSASRATCWRTASVSLIARTREQSWLL